MCCSGRCPRSRDDGRQPIGLRLVLLPVCVLVERRHHCPARHHHPVVSHELPPVLAVEATTASPAAINARRHESSQRRAATRLDGPPGHSRSRCSRCPSSRREIALDHAAVGRRASISSRHRPSARIVTSPKYDGEYGTTTSEILAAAACVHPLQWLGHFPGPRLFTTIKIHAYFEGEFVRRNLARAPVAAEVGPYHSCGCSIEKRTKVPLLASLAPRRCSDCAGPGFPKIRPAELLSVDDAVALPFLFCRRCAWEFDQAQLDQPPWSTSDIKSGERFRCPHDLPCWLVLSLSLVRDPSQKIVFRPRQMSSPLYFGYRSSQLISWCCRPSKAAISFS